MQFAGLTVAVQGALEQLVGDTFSCGCTRRRRPPGRVSTVAARGSLRAGGTRAPESRRLIEVAIVWLVFYVVGDQSTELKLMFTCHFAVIVRPRVAIHPVVPRSSVPQSAIPSRSPEDRRSKIISRGFAG